MRQNIASVLWCWSLLSPLLFRVLPGRDAAIACLLAGWAFLPVAAYPDAAFSTTLGPGDGGSAHAVAVPAWPIPSKATAIGLGCLAGLILFDRRASDRLRFGAVDLPMAAWCLVPIASTAANGLPLSEGLAQSRYLGLAWGVPYLMGRIYLTDEEGRRRFCLGLVAVGIAYLPACLFENAAGPSLYGRAYGPHPYQVEGAARALGYRPLVFQEHGNQLGMWVACSAVAATWLRATGASRRPFGIPGGPLAAALVASTLLCQSHASILYMGLALLPLLAIRIPARARSWRIVAIGLLGLAGLAALLLAARRGFDPSALRDDVRSFFIGLRKGSFTWRAARSAEFLPVALGRPVLGWARPDWAPGGRPFVNPVNLGIWLLVAGMYGLVGLAASMVAWVGPAARSIGRSRHLRWLGPAEGASSAMAALLLINALDGFTNSVMILPLLAAAGGLNPPTGPGRRDA